MIRLAGISAWRSLMVIVLNSLSLGYRSPSSLKVCRRGNDAQVAALERLHQHATYFVDKTSGVVPRPDWPTVLQRSKTDYCGGIVVKAVEMTWAQVEPALPPAGMAGRVSALELCGEGLKDWVRDPWRSVKPRSEWPRRLRKAYVRAKPGEWQKILEGLRGRQIVEMLSDDELIYHRGEPLLNGAFGVYKEDSAKDGFDAATAPLRLIANLMPSNDLQFVIPAEIHRLPMFSQWMLFELWNREIVVLDSEDMTCAFYLFELPRAWLPWFVFAEPLEPCDGQSSWVGDGQPCVLFRRGGCQALGFGNTSPCS